jgi:hypothetical protein
MMDRNYDETDFWTAGIPGAFALGVVERAPGDGMRAAWTVLPALGITLRPPRPRGVESARPCLPDDGRAALVMDAVCALYPEALTACGMPRERAMWDAEVAAQSWPPQLWRRCQTAFYGRSYGNGRLDLPIHAAARKIGGAAEEALITMSCNLGHLLWPHGHYQCSWWDARKAGNVIAMMTPILGERGWTEIERIAAVSRGAP